MKIKSILFGILLSFCSIGYAEESALTVQHSQKTGRKIKSITVPILWKTKVEKVNKFKKNPLWDTYYIY